jgi:hypothetical protein
VLAAAAAKMWSSADWIGSSSIGLEQLGDGRTDNRNLANRLWGNFLVTRRVAAKASTEEMAGKWWNWKLLEIVILIEILGSSNQARWPDANPEDPRRWICSCMNLTVNPHHSDLNQRLVCVLRMP